MSVAKVIELIGSSDKSFDDAIKNIVSRASKTVRNITGIEIISQKIKFGPKNSMEYRVKVKAIFILDGEKK